MFPFVIHLSAWQRGVGMSTKKKQKQNQNPEEVKETISEQKCFMCGKPADGEYLILGLENRFFLCKECAKIADAKAVKHS